MAGQTTRRSARSFCLTLCSGLASSKCWLSAGFSFEVAPGVAFFVFGTKIVRANTHRTHSTQRNIHANMHQNQVYHTNLNASWLQGRGDQQAGLCWILLEDLHLDACWVRGRTNLGTGAVMTQRLWNAMGHMASQDLPSLNMPRLKRERRSPSVILI